MSDRVYVLDASALLALMLDEGGADAVHAVLPMARIGAVNLLEVIAKLAEHGVPEAVIAESFAELDLDMVPFDGAHAMRAGMLRVATKHDGLSLGDRACLALAASLGAIALTTDRAWDGLDLGIEIELAR